MELLWYLLAYLRFIVGKCINTFLIVTIDIVLGLAPQWFIDKGYPVCQDIIYL